MADDSELVGIGAALLIVAAVLIVAMDGRLDAFLATLRALVGA